MRLNRIHNEQVSHHGAYPASGTLHSPGGGSGSRGQGRDEKRREANHQHEQARRKHISDGYDRLRELLRTPQHRDSKLPKKQVLDMGQSTLCRSPQSSGPS